MQDLNMVDFYKPLNPKSALVKRYTLHAVDQVELLGGIAWSALIYRNGIKVAEVSNNGDGGCNRYQWVNRVEENEFSKVAQTAYHGMDQFEGEEEDILVAWLDIRDNYASVAS